MSTDHAHTRKELYPNTLNRIRHAVGPTVRDTPDQHAERIAAVVVKAKEQHASQERV